MVPNLPAGEYKKESEAPSLEALSLDAPSLDKVLEIIVSRASSIYERLAYCRNFFNSESALVSADSNPANCSQPFEKERVAQPGTPDPEAKAVIQKRLETWCKLAANSEQALFEKRLAWENLDEDSVKPYLTPGFQFANGPAIFSSEDTTGSNWVDILREYLEQAPNKYWQNATLLEDNSFIKAETPFPFEEILKPFVVYAGGELRRKTAATGPLLAAEAWQSLERNLLERLTTIAEKTLYLEFSIFRTKKQTRLSTLLNRLATQNPSKMDHLYRQFVEKLLGGGLVDFFLEYSVLARRLFTTMAYWIDANTEFINRLAGDYPELGGRFNSGKTPGQVLQIKTAISDLHNRGRSVMVISFENNLKLVYKPKSLELEKVFEKFIDWCNLNGAPLPLKTLQVLTRPGYGWVEFAEYLPCQDQAAAGRFFGRMGIFLALTYALEGCDFHYENLIASGEHPVLVDLETLFYPFVSAEKNFASDDPDIKRKNLEFKHLWNTVSNTGFLPNWSQGPNKQSYDISGLGGYKGQQTSFQMASWKDLNSDGMQLDFQTIFLECAANLPELNGQPLKSEDYFAEIQAGFEQMYRFLLEKRSQILGEDGPLIKFKSLEQRFLFRRTRTYFLRIKKTLQPEFLRDGADCSLELDALSRPLLYSQTCPESWPILRQEHEAMFNLDIPLFKAKIDGTDLYLNSGETIKDFFSEPGYQAVRQKIKSLSPEDLQRQLNIIQASFFSRQAGNVQYISPQPQPQPAMDAGSTAPADLTQPSPEVPDRQLIIEVAISLAEKILCRAIRSETGSAEWMELAYQHSIGRYNVRPLGSDLYGGTPGIALFLAALDHYVPGRGYRQQALAAIQSERHLLRHSSQFLAKYYPVGGMTGLGSVVYTFVRLSELLKDETILQDACLAAALITPEKIAEDTHLDVLSGVAGCLLALLALYKCTGQAQFLTRAGQCGYHLLKNQVQTPTKSKSWATLDGKFLTGFSHGAAGIAYALAKLYEQMDKPLFIEAARQGLEYERAMFSPERQNWPDLRMSLEQPGFISHWCNGAAGIGLSRIGLEKTVPGLALREEIEAALVSVAAEEWENVDHLCCGNSGRISFLFEAAVYLKRPEMAKEAALRQAKMIELANRNGGFQLFAMLPQTAFNPAFMQGTAGIGYELLRSLQLTGKGVNESAEFALPSVLLLD